MSTTPDPDDVSYHLQASINRLKQALGHLEVPLAAFSDEWNRLTNEGEAGPHVIALERKLELVGDALRSMNHARDLLEDLASRL